MRYLSTQRYYRSFCDIYLRKDITGVLAIYTKKKEKKKEDKVDYRILLLRNPFTLPVNWMKIEACLTQQEKKEEENWTYCLSFTLITNPFTLITNPKTRDSILYFVYLYY